MTQIKILKSHHAGERIHRRGLLLVIGVATGVMLVLGQWLLFTQSRISSSMFWLLLVADPFLAAGIALLVARVVDAGSTGFASLVHAGGDIPYSPQYSAQQALVIRGDIPGAIESFRQHIATSPMDLEARLRLAALLAKEAGDPHAAELAYLEIRALAPSPQQTATLSNALIDIYRATGQHEQLKLELGRFARRFPNSREGVATAEYLVRLADDDRDASVS